MTSLKIEQRIWIDSSVKKTCKWPLCTCKVIRGPELKLTVKYHSYPLEWLWSKTWCGGVAAYKGCVFLWGAIKYFGIWYRWWSPNIINVLKTTELYTLKWLLVCYVSFTSITKCGDNVEKWYTETLPAGMTNDTAALKISLAVLQTFKQRTAIWPAIPLLSI